MLERSQTSPEMEQTAMSSLEKKSWPAKRRKDFQGLSSGAVRVSTTYGEAVSLESSPLVVRGGHWVGPPLISSRRGRGLGEIAANFSNSERSLAVPRQIRS